jgi:MFS family permease
MSASRFRLGAVLGINQTLSWGMTFYLPAIVAGPAAAALGRSELQILGAFSWSLLTAGACAPSVGKWIDRHGGLGALLASIVVIAMGQGVLAAAPNLAIWYLGWTVIGVGMSMGLYDAAFATVGGLLGQNAGPSITGITLVAGFASTVFWTLGAALIGPLGWRGLLLVYASLMLLVNLPMVWALVPPAPPRGQDASAGDRSSAGDVPDASRMPDASEGDAPKSSTERWTLVALGAFFALRWFITSAIAVHILPLLQGVHLSAREAVAVAALIGPGQVAGRMLEYVIGARVGVLAKARIGALLFPLGALLLLLGGPVAAPAFALMYGMSNGIMTINRGTLPLALFGPEGYARRVGWLAVPVLLAQATAPTVTAPLVAALPALDVFLLCGAGAAVAVLFLLPLRLPS